MPQGSRKTRDRQLAKLYERRRRERSHKRRQRIVAATVGIVVALGGVGGGLFLLTRGGKQVGAVTRDAKPGRHVFVLSTRSRRPGVYRLHLTASVLYKFATDSGFVRITR